MEGETDDTQRRIVPFRQSVPLSARLFQLDLILADSSDCNTPGSDDQGTTLLIESQLVEMSTRPLPHTKPGYESALITLTSSQGILRADVSKQATMI